MGDKKQAQSEATDLPIIDRNRISHKQAREISMQALQLGKEMDAARESNDLEAVDKLIRESDALAFTYVAYVPPHWFTEEGITVDTPEWWDYLGQGYYEELAKLVRPPSRLGEAPN
jgi:hypothetical protein